MVAIGHMSCIFCANVERKIASTHLHTLSRCAIDLQRLTALELKTSSSHSTQILQEISIPPDLGHPRDEQRCPPPDLEFNRLFHPLRSGLSRCCPRPHRLKPFDRFFGSNPSRLLCRNRAQRNKIMKVMLRTRKEDGEYQKRSVIIP